MQCVLTLPRYFNVHFLAACTKDKIPMAISFILVFLVKESLIVELEKFCTNDIETKYVFLDIFL